MLEKNVRICPCCGKKLVLTGRVLGDKLHDTIVSGANKSDTFEQQHHWTFEKDRLWSSQVDMFCSECGVQIKLQSNPQYLLVIGGSACLAVLLLLVAASLCGSSVIPVPVIISAAAAAALLSIVLICVYAHKISYIKKWHSNFIYVTEEPIKPHLALSADMSGLPPMILHPANIFTVEANKQTAALYLTDHTLDGDRAVLYLRVCGDERDRDNFIGFIQGRGAPVALDFEGRRIPSAELIKTLD